MSGGGIFGAAVVAFAFGFAGIIVWFIDSGVANALCATNIIACQQAMQTAYLALFIGIAALAVGILFFILALKS